VAKRFPFTGACAKNFAQHPPTTLTFSILNNSYQSARVLANWLLISSNCKKYAFYTVRLFSTTFAHERKLATIFICTEQSFGDLRNSVLFVAFGGQKALKILAFAPNYS